MSSGGEAAPASTGRELYKALVDHLAETARSSVAANRIRDWGHPERNNSDAMPYLPQEAERVAFFSTLPEQHKAMLARLLEDERKGAVHDVAALLEWLTTSQNLELRWQGHLVPESPFASYQYDLVCRLNGDPWPDELEKEKH